MSTKGQLNPSADGDPNLCSNLDSCQGDSSKMNNKELVISIVMAVLTLVLASIVLWRTIRKNLLTSFTETWFTENVDEVIGGGHGKVYLGKHENLLNVSTPKKFRHQDKARITENNSAVIGEGGYGKVYRWTLDNGVQVAVKTLLKDKLSKSGVEGFQAEVSTLTTVNHKNLVKLIGYCDDDDIEHLALVYEYMEGGSLQDHLLYESKRSQPSWRKRLQIALEVAEGLKYLHKDCVPPIIHRDIKPQNILLTKDLEAKIGDFGLSKMFENDSVNAPAIVETNAPPSHMLVTYAAGTPGYRDPKYETTKELSDKSDVYSFGVVLMVLITGLSAFVTIVERTIHITDWVHEKLSSNEIQEIIDESIIEEYDENSVLDFVKIAQKCTRMDHQERPDITEVVEEIKKLCTAYDNPQEQQIHVVYYPNLFEVPVRKKFTKQDIARIIKNGVEIGEGGYGKVYSGTLPNGEKVAVKTLKEDTFSGSGVEGFQAEVSTLTKAHHTNLVKLIGYCDDDIKHVALVYEYMEGRSLQDHLSDKDKRTELSWRKRLQIACEVAEGLEYLHMGCDPPIIHRDIKPDNILLTKDLEAKIGDFGFSKMFVGDGSHMSLKGFAGTRGYWDPEYVKTNQLRDKSDVYSFGVVLMVLIKGSSETAVEENIYISDWVRERLKRKEFEKIFDERIKEQYDRKSVLDFIKIAEKCTRLNHQERPDITKVVEDLEELCTAYDRGKTLFELKKFTRQDIATITANGKKIGGGGYGKVYRWTLPNGDKVAVKTLLEDKLWKSGVEGFQAEVSTLTKANHKNLVKFMGYCDDDIKHLALVYEYMEGGSLHDHLSDEGKRKELSWRKRLQIACEVAEGLKYLHKDCDPPIIHRHITPANIFLTRKLKAKIRGSGLSKMFEGDGNSEYVETNQIVYSFGVVLMQLITTSHSDQNIPITKEKFEEIVYTQIKRKFCQCVVGFAKLAVECTRNETYDITEVVKDLEKLRTAYERNHKQK